jgi:hypothetical protein
MKFEHFDPNWNKTYNKFTDFCEQITHNVQIDLPLYYIKSSYLAEEEQMKYSLAPVKDGFDNGNLAHMPERNTTEIQHMHSQINKSHVVAAPISNKDTSPVTDLPIPASRCNIPTQVPAEPVVASQSTPPTEMILAITTPVQEHLPPVSTRATRSQHKGIVEDDTDKKVWTYDTGEYLKEALLSFKGKKLVQVFRLFEQGFGLPITKVCDQNSTAFSVD